MRSDCLDVLEASPVTSEVLSAKSFLDLSSKEREKIKATQIVPPRLGGKDFGGVLVHYKTPIYRVG